jgi:hypothetical protein
MKIMYQERSHLASTSSFRAGESVSDEASGGGNDCVGGETGRACESRKFRWLQCVAIILVYYIRQFPA